MKEEFTPLLRAAMEKGCTVQVGTDMLFEMIPAYLEFFGFGTSTPGGTAPEWQHLQILKANGGGLPSEFPT